VTIEVKETYTKLIEEEFILLELLEKKQRIISYRDTNSVSGYASTLAPKSNTATYADSTKGTHDILTFTSILTIRSRIWIVYSGTSQHVTSVVGEFSSYICLTTPENIQTTDGMD
jgi:hypothetical protein